MSISEPQPFTEMPMTLYHAYGGKADWDGVKLPYGNNPYGKGYYWEKADAIHNPLPNLENPNEQVNKWNHRPDPVGIASCPMSELRMRGNLEYDENGRLKKIDARFFNTAFPPLIISQVDVGDEIRLDGMLSAGPFKFKVPGHIIKLQVKLGEKESERIMKADQIGIIPDKNQVFITYRFPFRYKFTALQIRKCELFETV
jgi:hypothetical protein